MSKIVRPLQFCGKMLCLLAICAKVLSFCNSSRTNLVLNADE
ncbi:hypothetical protein [uncultured Gammaproteobacteria bacterium]|nr:hypothetical protein [uncultured Gammaproteobacteria bacterium]CAC9511099.1 hypothetical protein [uncultured Gammaproteobacteria bacterium]